MGSTNEQDWSFLGYVESASWSDLSEENVDDETPKDEDEVVYD